MKKNSKIILIAVLALVVGVVAGYFVSGFNYDAVIGRGVAGIIFRADGTAGLNLHGNIRIAERRRCVAERPAFYRQL